MSSEWRRLGKYELRERLASGGQGEVWKAFDARLQRFVAIKRLNAHLQDDPDSAARFEREAQFVASLRHPNIVQIHDFQFVRTPDSYISTAYMVMDYIEGPTLTDYIRNTSRKRLFPPASDIVSIFTAVSLALDYAHQKGMIHRDIKPANIMLDQRNPNGKPLGEPILMDFGIAKLQGGSADTTKVLGTPLYVSPEQAQGLSGDRRSDLYSLGIVLYEIMTGLTPFYDASPMVILMRHYHDTPTSPTLINPAISPDLSNVILKSIAKDPDARFSSASAMTIALAEAFNIPVSPLLWKSAATPMMTNEANVPNLHSQSSGRTGTSPIPTVTPSSVYPPQSSVIASPLAFVPPANNNQTPAMIASDGSSAVYPPASMNNPPSPFPYPYQIPSAPAPGPQPSGKRPKLRLRIAAIILLALLVLGLGSYALFAPTSTAGEPSTVVGQVRFLSSQNTVGDLDQVQITLKGIPDGESYYAWLETSENSISLVHWHFTAHHGSLSPPSYTDPQYQNLLISPSVPYLFLITRESGSAQVPSAHDSDRLYYARIDQSKSAVDKYRVAHDQTFDIMSCPQGEGASNPCMS
jgi:serine/threonine protein kinase